MAYPQTSFVYTSLTPETLLGQRRQAVAANTLQYQLDVLKKTGRYDAFKLKRHPVYDRAPEVWPIPDHLFWDSDVAKWIEGACYFLQQRCMPTIADAVDELVQMIRSAQQPDGYLNIHYTVVELGKRFTNLKDMHELYNCGHLIEAALAHHVLYDNDQLLSPICAYVDLLCKTFSPGAEHMNGYPGHPEIELALLRLYKRTGVEHQLAKVGQGVTSRDPVIPIERATEHGNPATPLEWKFVGSHMRHPVFSNHAVQRLAQKHPQAIFLEARFNSTITVMASRALTQRISARSDSLHFQSVSITNTDKGVDRLMNATVDLWKQGLVCPSRAITELRRTSISSFSYRITNPRGRVIGSS
ncbi:DUF1680-domain-containing protein, partial [Aureobasidium melanogenum]